MGHPPELKHIAFNKYFEIFENSPEAILLASLDGKIQDGNLAARLLFDLEHTELQQSSIKELFSEEFLGMLDKLISIANSRENIILRTEGLNKQGAPFPAVVDVRIMRMQADPMLLLQIHDSTIQDQITNAFYHQDAILAAISFAAERFLGSDSWSKDVQAILQRLGEATSTQRVTIFQNIEGIGDQNRFSRIYEWSLNDTSSFSETEQDEGVSYSENGLERWPLVLGIGQVIYGPIDDQPIVERPALTNQGILSLCLVPIFVQHVWWGFISFEEHNKRRIWTSAEIDALRMVANLFGQAINRQTTDEELQQRQRYQLMLTELTQVALKEEDFQGTLDSLAQHLQALFEADYCFITLWQEEKKWAFPAAASGPGSQEYLSFQTEPGEPSATQILLEKRQVMAFDHFKTQTEISARIRETAPTTCILGIPLTADQRNLGAALLGFQAPHSFSEDETAFAQQIAGQISLILSKLILFEETRHQLGELLILQDIARATQEAVDEDELIGRVTDVLSQWIYPENFGVLLLDKSGTSLRYHPTYQGLSEAERSLVIPCGTGVAGKVIDIGESILITDTCKEPSYLGDCQRFRSELCVPVTLGSQVFGVINVESSQRAKFKEADIRLVETIAGQLGTAIHKLGLFQLERQRRQEAETLRQVTASLTASLDIDQVLNDILIQLEKVVPYDSSYLMLASKDGIRIVAGKIFHSKSPRVTPPDMVNYPHIQEIIQTRQPVIIPDTKHDERWKQIHGTDYICSWMGVPLIVKNQVIGILNLDKTEPGYYSERLAEIASAFANQAATAIDNARLYAELESAYLQTVLSLARAMDARDSYTAGHSQRICDLAQAVGKALGCSEDDILDLQWAALLHDIGKIGVPDEILRKPGPLSFDEWRVMRQHPLIGADIINPVSKLENVVPIVRHHQEKFDGSGYPDGLSGSEIPLGARILAVVDAYIAITDERVYRNARSRQEALLEIQRNIGTHFDPAVVEAFIQSIPNQQN